MKTKYIIFILLTFILLTFMFLIISFFSLFKRFNGPSTGMLIRMIQGINQNDIIKYEQEIQEGPLSIYGLKGDFRIIPSIPVDYDSGRNGKFPLVKHKGVIYIQLIKGKSFSQGVCYAKNLTIKNEAYRQISFQYIKDDLYLWKFDGDP